MSADPVWTFEGPLIQECSLPGERTEDGIAPAHPNGLQLSRDRFLLLNATLAFRGVDDSCSITWQLRADDWDGRLIREGFLARSIMDWDPFGLGVKWKKEMGAPIGFGVPKGALLQGKRVPHENVFMVKWRTCAREPVPGQDYLIWWSNDKPEIQRSYMIGWAQFELNDNEDDITILAAGEQLRQHGYETGDQLCEHPQVDGINQSFAGIWPANPEASAWYDIAHLRQVADGMVVIEYGFDPATRLYRWTRCGPFIDRALYESSILPYQDDWLIAARPRVKRGDPHHGIAWARLHDPIGDKPSEWVVPSDPPSRDVPHTAWLCPDGRVRLLVGDASRNLYAQRPWRWVDFRNPLFIFEIDPDHGFQQTRSQVICDVRAQDIPIPVEQGHIADMGKILPHRGGDEQVIVWRLRSDSLLTHEPDLSRYGGRTTIPKLTQKALEATGIYYGRLRYSQPQPPMWNFSADEP